MPYLLRPCHSAGGSKPDENVQQKATQPAVRISGINYGRMMLGTEIGYTHARSHVQHCVIDRLGTADQHIAISWVVNRVRSVADRPG